MSVVKKSVETRDKKTKKLTGRQSLVGKIAPKSAVKKVAIAKKVTAKKVVAKKPVKKASSDKVFQRKEGDVQIPIKRTSFKSDLFPSHPHLPGKGLSFTSFLSIIEKLNVTQMEKIVSTQVAVNDLRNYADSIEIAREALIDEDGDDSSLIHYEEEWLNAHPTLFGESSSYGSLLLDPNASLEEKVYEIAAGTHLALLARESLNIDETPHYEVLTHAWRIYVCSIHPGDDDIFWG